MDSFQVQRELRQKIRNGEAVVGIFVKTPSMHLVEVLCTVELDCLVLDAEHAPFSMDSLDQCILAARAAQIPALVRLGDTSASAILSVLDMGAAGVIIPHVTSAETARIAVDATRYKDGQRGFSASHRAGQYGRSNTADYIQDSDESTIVIGQIEDQIALDKLDEIAAVDELDAMFIGPADLSVSLGVESWKDPVITEAIDTICASGQKSGKSIGIFQLNLDEIKNYQAKGINLFLISTDQILLANATRDIVTAFKNMAS